MVSGLPGDFPFPPKEKFHSILEQKEKETPEGNLLNGGVFVRSELPEIDIPIVAIKKKLKIESENQQINAMEFDHSKQVKFCGNPPIEYTMFPDCEYDRTAIHKSGKWDKYLMQQ